MTATLFLAFLVATAGTLALVAQRWLPVRTGIALLAGLVIWLIYVGTLSRLGVVRDPALRPPGIVYVVGPVVLFVMFVVVRSRAAARVAQAVPLWLLIAFQVYRVGVELCLHRLWREGLAPRMLTFEGGNVDLWVGASAPIVAWLSTRGRSGKPLAFAWSILGLVSLANVVVRSALTAPGPLHLIDAEIANRAIGTFPYTYIAGFFAPLAVMLHVLALRALAAEPATPPAQGSA